MTVCPKCNGRGTVGYYHIDHFVDIECDRCNGSGEVSEVEMTNEEYLKSLDTEQLAEWFAHHSDFCEICEKHCDNDTGMQCNGDFKERWVEWLKQPHTNE